MLSFQDNMLVLEGEIANMKNDNFAVDDFKQEINTKVCYIPGVQPDTQQTQLLWGFGASKLLENEKDGVIHPKDQQKTIFLKEWLFQNSHNPSDKQCYDLAENTGLSFQQIKTWFTNEGQRLLPNDKSLRKESKVSVHEANHSKKHGVARLTATLNLCLIYFKIT